MKKLFVILCPAMLLSGAASAQVRVVPGTETVCLSNPSASVTFSTAEKFDIRSMKFADGKETVRPGDNVLPWTIIYHGPQGETPLVRPSCAIYKGYTSERTDSSATLVFRWDARLNYDGAGYPVEMRVTLGETSPLLAWNLSASCPEGWSVSEFNFPTIALASPDSASVITPGGWGNEYKLRRDTVYEANYPSWSASMQMMMVDDGSGVFFYSPRDYNACGKLMTVDERKGATTFTTHTAASRCPGPR